MSAAGAPHAGSESRSSPESIPVPASGPRCCRDLINHEPAEEPPAASDDVVSAAQILVSYLWNTEYERTGAGPAGHIMQQLRTLTRWLTTLPRD
ncbi:hypothetical protein AB0L62_07745 [Nocardia asteroides]|uniref:hypothetical protein n=1 Tax=Nocardia asteroides TaxID=1824 RepID=UPI00341B6529